MRTYRRQFEALLVQPSGQINKSITLALKTLAKCASREQEQLWWIDESHTTEIRWPTFAWFYHVYLNDTLHSSGVKFQTVEANVKWLTRLKNHKMLKNLIPNRQPSLKNLIGETIEIFRNITRSSHRTPTSDWSSPVVLVDKNEADLWFYADYPKLNGDRKRGSYWLLPSTGRQAVNSPVVFLVPETFLLGENPQRRLWREHFEHLIGKNNGSDSILYQ